MAKTNYNSKARKYQLTINNPIENGFNHDTIKSVLDSSSPIYYCLCDEKGSTYHTHIYVCYENAVHFTTMKKRFPTAHIETVKGTSVENREYIRKEGKHKDTEKSETNIPETFEEYGEIPQDLKTKNETTSKQVLEMIKDNYSNIEIINEFPSYGTKVKQLDILRQEYLSDKFSKTFRNIELIYIFGKTGTGKTRYVMEKYGYENVYKTSNYEHPFDSYCCQDVLLLDEFRSSIKITAILQYLDGYPCKMEARYTDKTACFTKVYIVSNEDLREQYTNIQIETPDSWQAFLRRIKAVYKFSKNDLPFGDDKPIIEEIPLSKYGARDYV